MSWSSFEFWFLVCMGISTLCIVAMAYDIVIEPLRLCSVKIDHDVPNKLGAMNENGSMVRGVAYQDYFCVYTKGLNVVEALQYCAHEYGHTNLGLKDPYVINWSEFSK